MLRTESEYKRAVETFKKEGGLHPLFTDNVDHTLRIRVQEQFKGGKGDGRFYRFVWDNKPHFCEECGKTLQEYQPTYISHIKSKGAHNNMRYDPRNINILCFHCHRAYEDADNKKRSQMTIYSMNCLIEEILMKEYYHK